MESDKEFQKKLCCYAFANLEHFLENRKQLDYPPEFDELNYPLFVTYNKDGNLRGCIGTFAENKLGKTLQSYSLIAALQDHRFAPIDKEELPKLSCEISLLSNFEPIDDPLGWEVGKHGIEIEFKGD